ncbi:NHLP-related RiPP peptide [Duganella sp. Leaf126]|uniref:NHLP-related RiPP peptide n=1 Tax=Duganella sp. Leaf126 TaxID=1736266 RepID=UPI000ABD7A4F|nr:NHLP-related RiPP peptide [Duganella sp. Leaf126]
MKKTVDQLSAMLAKLATDDDFRDRMLGDPVRTLRALGIELDPAKVPAARTLPAKQLVAADHAALESKQAGERSMVLFLLSGISTARLAS